MALTERTVVDKIEVLENGYIQVRTATVIEKDGVELTRSFHRHVRTPLCDCSNEDARVQAIAGVVHTPEVRAAEQARRDAKAAASSDT